MIIKLKIPEEFIEILLEKAGYILHKNGKSYVNNFGSGDRFHCYVSQGTLLIHLDITIEGKHKVAQKHLYGYEIKRERNRIRGLWRTINPVFIEKKRIRMLEHEKRQKEKIKKKRNIYAPNLMEIQRNSNRNPLT